MINPNYGEARYNLGFLHFTSENYDLAIKHFECTEFGKRKYYLLRCLFILHRKAQIIELLNDFINKKIVNPMVGSLVCRSSIKYGLDRPNLFCSAPLKYVHKKVKN